MEIMYAVVVAQITGVGLLFRWLHSQCRDNKLKLDLIYTKEETKEMMDLKNEPLAVSIGHVQAELKEVKQMIGRLLDEKNK